MKTILKEKNVLITGSAYGIGAALSKCLAKEGCRLILVDTEEAKLKETASCIKDFGGNPIIMIKDLSDEKQRESIFQEIAESQLSIDILINNVGIGYWYHLKDTPWNKLNQIIDTNIKSTVHMTKLALPHFLKKGNGMIVNISSTAAFIGLPNGVCYAGTKAFIRIFSEALDMELTDTGIRVMCVFPGATTTHFWEYAQLKNSHYHKNVKKMTAEEVAQETVAAIKCGRSEMIAGLKNKFNMLIVKFMPRQWVKYVARRRFKS